MTTLETQFVSAKRYGRREVCAVLDLFRYKPKVSNLKPYPYTLTLNRNPKPKP